MKKLEYPLKAAEIAEFWLEHKSQEAALAIVTFFHMETNDILEKRRVNSLLQALQTLEALGEQDDKWSREQIPSYLALVLEVLREQDDKWRAFARMVEGINPDGFKLSTHTLFPHIESIWPLRTLN